MDAGSPVGCPPVTHTPPCDSSVVVRTRPAGSSLCCLPGCRSAPASPPGLGASGWPQEVAASIWKHGEETDTHPPLPLHSLEPKSQTARDPRADHISGSRATEAHKEGWAPNQSPQKPIKKAEHQRTDASNCAVGEDSWESLGLQGDPTSPS